MNDLILLSLVAALVILDFIAGWWFGTKIKNYSLVDALWAAWIGLAGILFAVFGSGDIPKRIAEGSCAVALVADADGNTGGAAADDGGTVVGHGYYRRLRPDRPSSLA